MDFFIVKFLSSLVKVLDTLSGRDRITKILQYGAKILSYFLERRKQFLNKHLLEATDAMILMDKNLFNFSKQNNLISIGLNRTQKFESSISDARKVFRFFKSIGSLLDVYQFFIKVILPNYFSRFLKQNGANTTTNQKTVVGATVSPPKIKITDFLKVIQKILLSIYILYDHASWFAKVGLFSDVKSIKAKTIWQRLFNNSRTKDYSDYACKMWFISMIFTVLADLFEFIDVFIDEIKLLNEQLDCLRVDGSAIDKSEQQLKDSLEAKENKMRDITNRKNQITRNLIKNVADLGVSGNGGFKVWNLNNAVVGFCGCLSAFVGLYESWPKP
ncbi:hypothetical protein ABK040_000766 [Willaertia magna]